MACFEDTQTWMNDSSCQTFNIIYTQNMFSLMEIVWWLWMVEF